MEKRPQKISVIDLYQYTRGWTNIRLRSFPLWEFDDIHHEAFVFGTSLISSYNSQLGTVHQFLSQRLYDYVSRSYYKKNDIIVCREVCRDGRMGKRVYKNLLTYRPNSELPDSGYTDSEVQEHPDLSSLSNTICETAMLLAKGRSQKQCSEIAGISQSAVSQRVIKLRDLLNQKNE